MGETPIIPGCSCRGSHSRKPGGSSEDSPAVTRWSACTRMTHPLCGCGLVRHKSEGNRTFLWCSVRKCSVRRLVLMQAGVPADTAEETFKNVFIFKRTFLLNRTT
uniref:Uncharacterized protein n=1 Tax=Anguilla anguilla TaxID=7936 RepID=A0A0E9VU40_ANGAN